MPDHERPGFYGPHSPEYCDSLGFSRSADEAVFPHHRLPLVEAHVAGSSKAWDFPPRTTPRKKNAEILPSP